MSLSGGKVDSGEGDFEFKWDVKINPNDFTDTVHGKCLLSPPFVTNALGERIKWCLQVYPKGLSVSKENMVWIGLKNLSNIQVETGGQFYILIKHTKEIKKWNLKTCLFKQGDMCGRDFIHLSSLMDSNLQLLVPGDITIGFRLEISNIIKQKSCFRTTEVDDFEEIVNSQKFYDLTIISADGKRFYVHKGILASRSNVFKATFDEMEKTQKFLVIEDFSYKVLLEMLRFIYCGKVNEINPSVSELMYAAEKYCIEDLKILCEETITNLKAEIQLKISSRLMKISV